jgi:hypothetical protein
VVTPDAKPVDWVGQTGAMTDHASRPSIADHPELSSIASALEDLRQRLGRIATELDRPPSEDLASDLFEVERSVRTASRRLTRLVSRLS